MMSLQLVSINRIQLEIIYFSSKLKGSHNREPLKIHSIDWNTFQNINMSGRGQYRKTMTG